MTAPFVHHSIMVAEVVAALAPRSDGFYVDATVGGGGHAEALLHASAPQGQVWGVDQDAVALAATRSRLASFGGRLHLKQARFSQLELLLRQAEAPLLDGLVADLGVSSPQLDEAGRGFSLQADGPLDMRMNQDEGETAGELLARLSEGELADVLYHLGEERHARRVARRLKQASAEDRLHSTADLRRVVVGAVGPKRGRIDPSTRTFMALRIAVNRELEELQALLEQLPRLLQAGAVAAILSFHSLEDRLVKRAFRGDGRWQPLSKKPVVAAAEELQRNPRAGSAKLRAARWCPYAEAA